MTKELKIKIVLAAVLIVLALISIFIISPKVSSVEFHQKTIESLDNKKLTAMGITAAATVAATKIDAIPGDFTTPIANQVVRVGSSLLIVVGAILLEKMLLTLTGSLTFSILIPVACGIYLINLFVGSIKLKEIASKIAVFGLVIFLVIPFSVKITDKIEADYKESIQYAQNIDIVVEEEAEDDNWFNNLVDNVKNSVNRVVEKLKQILNNFIDAVAILIITTCIMPILVLIFVMWVVKFMFGVTFDLSKIKGKINEKAQKEVK